MRWLTAAASLVVLASSARAEVFVSTARHADTERGMAALTEALRRDDVRAVQATLAIPLANHGVWFADRGCAKQFSTPGLIDAKAAPAFARCLAKLTPQLSTRRSAQRDGEILTYAPGVELELGFRGTKVVWLGPPVHRDGTLVPMLTAQAFEALRTRGTTLLDEEVGPALAPQLGKRRSVSAWLKVCLDPRGKVTTLTHHDATSTAVGEAFVAAAKTWAFSPFQIRGAPVAACSLSLLTYPAAYAPPVETLPRTPFVATPGRRVYDFEDIELEGVIGGGSLTTIHRPAITISARQLERLRMSGKADIQPTAPTLRQMLQAKKLSVSARARVCLDATGAVDTVTLLRKSGFADYDAQLVRDIKRWRFKPYVVGNVAAAACANVTFMVTPDPTMNNP